MHSGEPARRRTQTLDESLLVDPEESDRPIVDFIRATPGRWALVAVVLVAALLAVGAIASKTVFDRQGQLATLRSHTEPLADAAQRIYGALSFANATAATAFLSGGVEPHDVRDRYDAAIGQASAGLVTASNGVSPNDIRSLTLLTDISNQLAVYTGLVATARANNRAGRPISVAYLGESSALMQHDILPAAEQLYASQSGAVIASERAVGSSRAVIAAAVLVLVLLVLAQAALARRSRRRLNPGLVLASVLMAVLVVWLTVAGLVSTQAATTARTHGGEPLDTAVSARIFAQQGRADEILGLLNRGSDTLFDIRFDERTAQIGWLLDEHRVNGAADALHGWMRSHDEIRRKLAGGDYGGAVAIARDDAPQHSTAQFTALDSALRDDITALRDRQRDGITDAYTALNLLPAGAAAISVLAALAVAAGIAPRLRRVPLMRAIGTALGLAVILLAGCSTVQPLAEVSATRTTLPMPSGATTVPYASGAAVESCDATTSLRPSTATGPAVEAIRRRGRLIAGVDQSTNLFSFRDPVSGELQGFDIDIAREVRPRPPRRSRQGGVPPADIAGAHECVAEWSVDIVAKALTVTCARAEQIAFSTVYFEASQRLLVPKDSPVQGPADLAGLRVCSQVDTTSLATVSRLAPTATLLAVQNWDDCLVALQQGQADAASTDNTILAGMAVQDPNLHIVGPSLEAEPYGIGINKSQDDLVRAVNASLERIRRDGTWLSLYRKWLTVLGPAPSPPEPKYRD